MKELPIRNHNFLRGGCDTWTALAKVERKCAECERCGFNPVENKRRKQIPLTLCEDGLYRKIIPKRPGIETKEDEK